MGKKKGRASYTSKGGAKSVSHETKKAMRRERPFIEVFEYKVRSWTKNKPAYLTIPNPDKNATNKRFIRVPINDSRALGEYRKYLLPMKQANND